MPKKRFIKTSFEQYEIEVDFTDDLPLGSASISSGTLTAYKFAWKTPETKTDDSATVLQSTTATIVDNTKAWAVVKAGSDGYGYEILFQVTFDDGSKLEESVIMKVEDNVSV